MNEERAWKIYVIQKQERCYFTLQVKKQRFRVSKKIAYGDLVKYCRSRVQFLSVQWLSHVRLFVIPWITACQASLSITNSRNSPKLRSIKSVMHNLSSRISSGWRYDQFSWVLPDIPSLVWGFPGGSVAKNLPVMQETWVQSLGWECPLEKEMATHCSILAWRIPKTGETGRL